MPSTVANRSEGRAGPLSRRLAWLGLSSGFPHHAIVTAPAAAAAPRIVRCDLPPPALAELAAAADLASCSLFGRLARSTAPFGWTAGRNCLAGLGDDAGFDDGAFAPVLARHGIAGGLCVPVAGPQGERGAVLYLGPRPEEGAVAPGLVGAARTLFAQLLRFEPTLIRPEPPPPPLEARILALIAHGLDHHDIAVETGLSETALRAVIAATIRRHGARDLRHLLARLAGVGPDG